MILFGSKDQLIGTCPCSQIRANSQVNYLRLGGIKVVLFAVTTKVLGINQYLAAISWNARNRSNHLRRKWISIFAINYSVQQ